VLFRRGAPDQCRCNVWSMVQQWPRLTVWLQCAPAITTIPIVADRMIDGSIRGVQVGWVMHNGVQTQRFGLESAEVGVA
jgi:hypothetical protein